MNENQQFAEVAKRYCAWVDAERHDLAEVRILLLELLLKVTGLRHYVQDSDSSVDYDRMSHDEWKTKFDRLNDVPFQYYNIVTTHGELTEEPPLVASLNDDLADIYRDLQAGLQAWGANDEAQAAWQWYSNYVWHWGNHATAALHAVDEYMREQIEL